MQKFTANFGIGKNQENYKDRRFKWFTAPPANFT